MHPHALCALLLYPQTLLIKCLRPFLSLFYIKLTGVQEMTAAYWQSGFFESFQLSDRYDKLYYSVCNVPIINVQTVK